LKRTLIETFCKDGGNERNNGGKEKDEEKAKNRSDLGEEKKIKLMDESEIENEENKVRSAKSRKIKEYSQFRHSTKSNLT